MTRLEPSAVLSDNDATELIYAVEHQGTWYGPEKTENKWKPAYGFVQESINLILNSNDITPEKKVEMILERGRSLKVIGDPNGKLDAYIEDQGSTGGTYVETYRMERGDLGGIVFVRTKKTASNPMETKGLSNRVKSFVGGIFNRSEKDTGNVKKTDYFSASI